MGDQVVSRRELFFSVLKKMSTPGKTISMYTIDDILPLTFKWRTRTKWAENNEVLSVSTYDDELLFSSELSDIQRYISRHLDGTQTLAELCDAAMDEFPASQKQVYDDTFKYIHTALEHRIIETVQ